MNNKIIISSIIIIVFSGVLYWLVSDKTSSVVIPMETDNGPITSGENPQPGSQVHDLPIEPAAAIARKGLAAKLLVDEKTIVIMEVKETTWSDGCLGLGGPAESCLQALVPGFKVEMLVNGKTYFYRTDKTGGVIRLETK
jgi:hypothetical protein